VYGLSTSSVGYLLAIQSVASVISRIPAGRLVDRFEHTGRLVVPSIVGFAACQAVLPHLSGFWAPALVLAIGMPFSGIAMTALGVLFARAGEGGGRGTSMGFFSAVMYSGMAAGPAIFGPVMNVDFSLGFTVSAVVAIVLGLATVRGLGAMTQSRPPGKDLAAAEVS
jgi:MFS family permease